MKRNAIRIAVSAQKGGVAKTVTTVEVATCLANKGKRVLVVDFDRQNDSTKRLNQGYIPELDIMDILREKCGVVDAIAHGSHGVDLIASSESLSQIDIEFSYLADKDNVNLLDYMLNSIDDEYDYILFDCAPTNDISLNMCYIAADYIICPTLSDADSLDGVRRTNDALNALKADSVRFSNAEIIGVLLVQLEGGKGGYNVNKVALRNLEQYIATNLNKGTILDYIRKATSVSESITVRESLQFYDRQCKAAVDYRRFTDKILKYIEQNKAK